MKHTPKPWETGHFGELQEDDELEFGRIYGPGENTIVCDVYHEKDMACIAAAPELLEACEYAIEKLKDVKGKTFPILPILNAIKSAKGI